MNLEVKEKWLQALRSGEYKQGEGWLKHSDEGETKHCCLGVLCEIYAKENNVHFEEAPTADPSLITYLLFDHGDVLPEKVREWAGLEHPNPVIYPDSEQSLASMNDSGYFDFKRIAKIIEENL